MKSIAKSGVLGFTLLASSLFSLTDQAQAFSLEGTLYSQVAETTGVDPVVLYALTLVETNYQNGNWKIPTGMVSPWPYTIRDRDGAQRFSNEEEARGALTQSLAKYQNVDIGISQINWKWHGKGIENPALLLDPVFNLTTAAKYLKESMALTTNAIMGIGFYHNRSDKARAKNYGARVMAIASNLRKVIQGD